MIGELFLRRKDFEVFVKNLNRRLSSLSITKPTELAVDIGVSLDYMDGSTYETLQDWVNTTQSAGKISGGAISDDGDGTITVATGTGFIKISAVSAIEDTLFFNWPASAVVPLVNQEVNYIYVEYNAGTPRVWSTTTRSDIHLSDQFTLGRVFKDNGTLHIVNSGTNLANFVRRDHERLVACRWIENASGGIVSEPAALKLKTTAGVFYIGSNEIETISKDTNIADTFEAWYRDGGVGWSKELAQTDVNIEKYDDGSGALQDIPANKYSARYVYIDFDSHIHVQYGQQGDKLALIQAEEVPAPPAFLNEFAILAARVIVKDGVSPVIEIAMAYSDMFQYKGISEHNSLADLQGGAADEYYHFTNVEHTELAVIAALGRGIADNNLVQIDDADVAEFDYAKFTASGLQGRSYDEVLADLSGEALAAFDWNSQNLLSVPNLSNKTTAAWNKSIGVGGDYPDWATMIAAMPNLIAHAVTVTIKTGTTLTETCELKNKHGITKDGKITIKAERYFPTSGAISTADSATATTLRDAALAAAALGDDYFNGCWVFIVHGTGTDNGFVPITDYVDATGDVVVGSWTTQPDNTSRYIIVGALIGGTIGYGFDIQNCRCPLFLYGIGVKDAIWNGYHIIKFNDVTMRYCGVYDSSNNGISVEILSSADIRYCGVAKNNTDNNFWQGGISVALNSAVLVYYCGISDNNQQGVNTMTGSFADIYSCFGDGNGAWGTYARWSGQAWCRAPECSGTNGNHSDPGTAGNPGADQAAAY